MIKLEPMSKGFSVKLPDSARVMSEEEKLEMLQDIDDKGCCVEHIAYWPNSIIIEMHHNAPDTTIRNIESYLHLKFQYLEAELEREKDRRKLKSYKPSKKMTRQVKEVLGSMYSMNAPHRKGYLFNYDCDKGDISRGMYQTSPYEINEQEWDYYFEIESGNFYTIEGE